MDLQAELKSLASLKGNALKVAKQKILDTMSPDDLRRFFEVCDASELKQLSKMDYWPHQKDGSEREVGFYEALRAPEVIKRLKPASAVALLRSKTSSLEPDSALAALERHPDDAGLLGRLETVDQFRRGCALVTSVPAYLAADLAATASSPGELGRIDAIALAKLGVTWRDIPATLEFPRVYRSGTGEWSGKDPHGDLVPGRAAWAVAKAAVFPTQTYQFQFRSWDTGQQSLQLGSGGEIIDTTVNGKRVILAPIGYVPEVQYYIAVDLTQTGNLSLYTFDHDGTGASTYGYLNSLLTPLAAG